MIAFLPPTQFPQNRAPSAFPCGRRLATFDKTETKCDGFDRWRLQQEMIDGIDDGVRNE